MKWVETFVINLNKLSYAKFPCLEYPFYHSIPFFHFFFNFPNPSNHSISFYFFQLFFFNFPNPYIISLNLNHSYYFEISKVKQFLHHFYKPFSNHSKLFSNHFLHPKKWNWMAKITSSNTRLIFVNESGG